MLILDNVPCSDAYNDQGAAIEFVINSNGGYFALVNNPVYMQLAYNVQGQIFWTKEVPVPVGTGILFPGTAGVRFRNYNRGATANVSAALSENKEPSINLGSGGIATTTNPAVIPVLVLPAAPTDGQTAILTDSLTVPTWAWELSWSATAARWNFIGGSPFHMTANGGTITSAAYTDFPSNCTFTVPRAGVYIVSFGAFGFYSTTTPQSNWVSIKKGTNATADVDAVTAQNLGTSQVTSAMRIVKTPALAINDIIKTQGRSDVGSLVNQGMFMEVYPQYVT